jgi:branched-chain amino acid transport system ATP-binding protein
VPPGEATEVTGDDGGSTPEVTAAGGIAALTVSEVAVRFGGVSALNDVTLTVEPGTVTGLIGPNGAGKTTLFNVISGLQVPDRGSVHLFDTDVTTMKPHRRARLGLARTFQRLEIFGTLTASENVRVGLESSVKWWDWHRLRRAFPWNRHVGGDELGVDGPNGAAASSPSSGTATCDRLLEGVGLAGLGDEQSATMSTGLARMVELARALAIGPKLLLLDEPGSGLDETESRALGELLSKLAADGMAVLLVEHDMELVMRICDHIYVLDFGDIIAAGSPDAIRTDPMVQAAYLGEATPENDPDTAATVDDAATAGTTAGADDGPGSQPGSDQGAER